MSPNINAHIEKLPKVGTLYLLLRDVGGQYERRENIIAASQSKDYIDRLKAQLIEAEREEQMPEAIGAWRSDLVERGVPGEVAATLPPPEFAKLTDSFEFFESYWSIREVPMIDAEKAIRREAMLARARGFDAERNCQPPAWTTPYATEV